MAARGPGVRMIRMVIGTLAGLLLVLLAAPAAGAHAYLEHSNPADGSTILASPHELELGFSEHVLLSATRISVTDDEAHQVSVSHLRLEASDAANTDEPASVVARLRPLSRGTYQVKWETLSSDDLHRTFGFFVFGVRTSVAASPFRETAPLAGDALLIGALLLGLALALGGLLARRVLSDVAGESGAAVRRALWLTVEAGAALALAASLVQPVVQAALRGASLAQLAMSWYGVRWSVREAGLVLLVLAAWTVGRPSRERLTRALVVPGAVLAAGGVALLGHAATGGRVHPDRVVVTATHLLAALTWAGAVVCLTMVLVGLRVSRGLPVTVLRNALRGFAGPAAACVGVLAVTGLYLGSGTVGSVDAALGTIYGRTLLGKLLLACAAGGLALVNHRRLRGRRDLQVPSRTIATEAVLALLLVGATAVLASAQPATEPQLVDSGPATTRGPLGRQVRDLQVALDVRPNRPGSAVVVVTVFDTRRPSPGPVTTLSVRLGDAPDTIATHVGDGRWIADFPHLAGGTASMRVLVTRQGAPRVVSTFSWTVGPGTAPPRTVLSRAPLHATLVRTAALLGVLLVGGWLLVLGRRRPRPPRGADGASRAGTDRVLTGGLSVH